MKIVEFDLSNIPTEYHDIALCLGFFDGIHLGHQRIIQEALSSGKQVGLLSFDTPPAYVIGRKDTKRSLTSVDDKADILEDLGVSYLFIMPFNDRIKELTKMEFITMVLKTLNPSKVYCGEDYTFGKGGEGNPKLLANYFDLTIVPLVKIDGEKFSSQSIRHLIFEGKIKEANERLGHYYRVGGIVVDGNHIGGSLGFPTANLDLDFPYVIPSNGVYIGYALIHYEKYKCLISVGTHPTLKELDASIIEVYVLDFQERLYGDFIFVEFVDKLREMIKFNSVDELKEQIRKDKISALKMLK